jgi:4-hydroxybenzoate polyprenyltransferase
MKVLGFIIHSNILIALAALALTLATQVQLGMEPQAHAYLAVIFLATLFDYNLHRYLTLYNKPEAVKNDKLKWAKEHLNVFIALIILSFGGLVIVLFYVKTAILYLLVPLAVLSFLYSFPFPGKQKHNFRLLNITGMKTLLIALVWTGATVLIPVLFADTPFDRLQIILLFAERFTFIFAIAIPFDIRDMETDSLASIRTIPIVYGEKNALKISNVALLLSLLIALFHYLDMKMEFILPAYIISIVTTFIFINTKAFKRMTFYHHGILDGSILLQGILIFLSFILKNLK